MVTIHGVLGDPLYSLLMTSGDTRVLARVVLGHWRMSNMKAKKAKFLYFEVYANSMSPLVSPMHKLLSPQPDFYLAERRKHNVIYLGQR